VLGQVWPVQTDRGRWAVKEPFEAQDEAAEEANATFAELVFASCITTPQTMRTPDGRLLAAVDGKQFRVYSWVEIEDADPNIDPALVGELVAKLHLIRVHRDEEVDPWFTDPVGADRWRDLAAQHAARRSQWARSLAEYVTELAALEAMLEPPQALQVCHRDLWADNVRRHKPGGLCVFDWEDAGNGDPSHELAAVLFEYARGDPVRAHTLMSAYIEAGGPGRIAGRGTFTMAIAQLGHIGERSCQIWLDSDDPEERERADAGLQEFLDARLSISGIDLLIGAAQSADSAGRHS
jgi:Ser/Thr protein kinase RdoA (MazF antagonist)